MSSGTFSSGFGATFSSGLGLRLKKMPAGAGTARVVIEIQARRKRDHLMCGLPVWVGHDVSKRAGDIRLAIRLYLINCIGRAKGRWFGKGRRKRVKLLSPLARIRTN